MEITVRVEGMDRLVRNLRDLGINRISNYAARALTEIANQTQDAMIAETRKNLVVRGNWLTKGYKFGINRKPARKNNLEARVSTTAPWLVEQETKTVLAPREASSLLVPRIWQRWTRLATTKSPKNLRNTVRLKTKYGNEIIYKREGKGRLSSLVPLFILRKRTPQPTRVHLVKNATRFVQRIAGKVMDAMVKTAIVERGF